MKRRDLVSHLTREGCVLHREGGKHSVFMNPETGIWLPFPGTGKQKSSWQEKYAVNWISPYLGQAPSQM